MTVVEWVIGSSGQLGSAVSRIGARQGVPRVLATVDWSDPGASGRDLLAGIDALLEGDFDQRHVYWAAGASVTSAVRASAEAETRVFCAFVDALVARLAGDPRAAGFSLFFASSAGGVYSGSPARPPFTEDSPTSAITAYGDAKLAMERALEALAAVGAHVLIGRLSTLYGPDQRVSKPQGFISHLCRAYLTREPLSVYVPLDTMRDYIHSDDAGAVARAGLSAVAAMPGPHPVVIKNIGSLAPSTLGQILAQARLVFKRKPQVILAASALSAGQVIDLRIGSVVLPELDLIPRRPLLVGLAETRAAMDSRLRSAS